VAGFPLKNVRRASIVFRPDTGALLVFAPKRVQLFTTGWEPTAMVKAEGSGGWRRNRGGGLFEFRYARLRVRRHQRALEEAPLIEKAAASRYEAASLARFLELIPGEIKTQLRGYHSRSWPIYNFLARCGDPAISISSSNQALAFSLANISAFTQSPSRWKVREVRSLCLQRRHEIAGQLGFPPTKGAVHILSRVTEKALAIDPLFRLRAAMHDEKLARRLSHLPRINPGCLRIVSDPTLLPHASQAMLIQVARDRSFDGSGRRLAKVMMETLAMLTARQRRTMLFRGLMHLHNTHDELIECFGQWHPASMAPFPDAPRRADIPGCIELLASPTQLWEESQRMHSCIASASYIKEAREGRIAVYRVLKPERCTLALVRNRALGWHILELRCRHNRSARRDTYSAIRRWWLDGRPLLRTSSRTRSAPYQLSLLPQNQPIFIPRHGADCADTFS
jgi:hypothetical protein